MVRTGAVGRLGIWGIWECLRATFCQLKGANRLGFSLSFECGFGTR